MSSLDTSAPSRSPFAVAADLLDPAEGRWRPLPHQRVPGGEWTSLLWVGGRGSGKTDAAANWLTEHVFGPPCDARLPGGHRPAIIAPTLGDAAESCFSGPSGIKAHCPEARLVQSSGGTHVRWPNGVEAKLFGAYSKEDVERLRAGGGRCCAWLEELCAWVRLDDCWDHIRFGLRLGEHPRMVVSTTPKPRKRFKELIKEKASKVIEATTYDNPHLPEQVRQSFIDRYEGTRLGRQELYAQLLEDVEGALWDLDLIEQFRRFDYPTLRRIGVGVDPSGGRTETGIVVAGITDGPCPCGRGPFPHAFVLDDLSCSGDPNIWPGAVVWGYHQWKADRIFGERNFGGAMVEHAVRVVDPSVSYEDVNASRGKMQRAEPVLGLYQKGRVHHVGVFPELEDEMTTWVPGETDWSPNRVDAGVWALTELLVNSSPMTAHFPPNRKMPRPGYRAH